MTSGLAIMPLVFSNGTFCTRRTQSGADALTAGNPYVGAMNMNIAGGQILKAAEGVTSIAKESKNTLVQKSLLKHYQREIKFCQVLGKL